MRVEYPIRLADYQSALTFHTKRSPLHRVWYFVLMRIAPTVALFCLIPVLAIHVYSAKRFDLEALGLLMVMTFCFGVPILQYSDMRRQFNAKFPNDSDRKSVLAIGADEIVSMIPGQSEVRLPWSAVTDFAQNERMTLIYVGENLLFVPTEVFSTSELDELNGLVAQHMVKRQQC